MTQNTAFYFRINPQWHITEPNIHIYLDIFYIHTYIYFFFCRIIISNTLQRKKKTLQSIKHLERREERRREERIEEKAAGWIHHQTEHIYRLPPSSWGFHFLCPLPVSTSWFGSPNTQHTVGFSSLIDSRWVPLERTSTQDATAFIISPLSVELNHSHCRSTQQRTLVVKTRRYTAVTSYQLHGVRTSWLCYILVHFPWTVLNSRSDFYIF